MTHTEDVDAAIERAGDEEWTTRTPGYEMLRAYEDRRLLAEEVVRLRRDTVVLVQEQHADIAALRAEIERMRRFVPPDGWVQFGTHANCRAQAQIELSAELGEDGLPLWERPVSVPCTCGYGGFHEEGNPLCEINQREEGCNQP